MAGKKLLNPCVLCGDREITVPSTDTCKNCYSAVLNWSKRPSEHVNRRARQLGLYQRRMMIIASADDNKAMRPSKIQLKAMPGKIKLKEHRRLKGKYKTPPKKL